MERGDSGDGEALRQKAMEKRSGRKDGFAGGLGILAVASYACIKALKAIDARLKKKSEKKP